MSEKFDPNKHLRLLKGKGGSADYLDVKWRLVWLRSEHPDAVTGVEHVEISPEIAIFKATVSIPGGGSATDYGSETPRDFGDYLEKAATKAMGRALAQLGYGTQFVGFELDENTRIVDSPVQRDDDGHLASKPAQFSGQQRYDHARRNGKDPATNDAPMWNNIEEAMEDDFRRSVERAGGFTSAPRSNESAPPRVPTPPAAQSAPQTPAPALAPDDPLAEVLATLRQMEGRREPWATIKAFADTQADLADDYGKKTITGTLHAIAQRRKAAAPAAPKHEVS